MEMENEKTAVEEVNEAGLEESHGTPELQSEADLTDHHEGDDQPDEDSPDQPDFSQYSKTQLVEAVKALSAENDFSKAEKVLREYKQAFDELREKERTAALNRFILDGGTADGFEFKGDEFDGEFDSLVRSFKERRHQHIKNREDQKNDNLNKKLAILEKLREITDSQEVTNQFDQFKELQKEWKTAGPVPSGQIRSLWANYHALIDRFYDNQSIYFELKELDRKRNLEAKIELCVRAEKLIEVEKIKDAVRELNELHHEFKHIGPVTREEKEIVWQRFKAASDAIYVRRDAFLKNLQEEFAANVETKMVLCEEVLAISTFQSDRIKEWNQKTKDILKLQERWEASGGLPRNKAREINKKFWTAFKLFFSNKNTFFKKLDEERGQNQEKKKQIIQRAIELKESSDWEKTSNELKDLQRQWKEVGPVPEKFRQKLYLEFKEACDYFFEHRRNQQGKKDAEYEDNLKAKEAICTELENHIAEKSASETVLKELEEKYNAMGFVPKAKINAIRTRYQKAVEQFVNAIEGVSDDEKGKLMLEHQLDELKGDPMADQKIYHKEQVIRKKISKVENDLALWRNNLEFFARSKNAEKVREEFNGKIQEASDHLTQLKQQLKLLQTVS